MEKQLQKLIVLAQKIQPLFSSFYLAEGTNLMIKYQHRLSTDLDFFSEKNFSFYHFSINSK